MDGQTNRETDIRQLFYTQQKSVCALQRLSNYDIAPLGDLDVQGNCSNCCPSTYLGHERHQTTLHAKRRGGKPKMDWYGGLKTTAYPPSRLTRVYALSRFRSAGYRIMCEFIG